MGVDLKVGDVFTMSKNSAPYPYNTFSYRVTAVYTERYDLEIVERNNPIDDDADGIFFPDGEMGWS